MLGQMTGGMNTNDRKRVGPRSKAGLKNRGVAVEWVKP